MLKGYRIAALCLGLLALSLHSCTKQRILVKGEKLLEDIPDYFVQKALIEVFTGEWCGWCPEGAEMKEYILNDKPERVIAVSVHHADDFEIPEYNEWLKDEVQVSGFPNASIQRNLAASRGTWRQEIDLALAGSPACGLAIASDLDKNDLDLDIYVGLNGAMPNDTRLSVFIIENEVSQSTGGQSNYSQSVTVDKHWKHNQVLRAVLTPNEGQPIDLTDMTTRSASMHFENLNLKDYNIGNYSNCEVVAFVHKNQTSDTFHFARNVYNVQSAKLHAVSGWN